MVLIIKSIDEVTANTQSVQQVQQQSVLVKDNKVCIETQTLSAVIEKGILTSLKSKISQEEFIEKPDIKNFRTLQLLYIRNEVVEINEGKFGSIALLFRSLTRGRKLYFKAVTDGNGRITGRQALQFYNPAKVDSGFIRGITITDLKLFKQAYNLIHMYSVWKAKHMAQLMVI